MTRKDLESLIAFAKATNNMHSSVEEVLGVINNLKPYRSPRTKVIRVYYPRKRLSFIQMETLKKELQNKRNGILSLFKAFGIKASVQVGGSLSLKFQSSLWDRDFHDVDMIVTPVSITDRNKLRVAMNALVNAGLAKANSRYYVSECSNYTMGTFLWGKDLPVNILISDVFYPFINERLFNHCCEVVAAKRQYIKDARKKGVVPRWKDLIDLYRLFNNI